MKIKTFGKLGLFALLLMFVPSCSQNSDSEDYQSLPPTFSGMQISNEDNPGGDLKTGDNIRFTGIQANTGILLLGTTYTWSITPDINVDFEPVISVNYGVNNSNPTNIFKFSSPGTYRVTLKAKYATAGSKGMTESRTENFTEDKCRISYEVFGAAIFHYLVTIDKYVTIK